MEPKYYAFRRCLDTPGSSFENMTIDAWGMFEAGATFSKAHHFWYLC